MDIFRVTGIGLSAMVLAVLLRGQRPETAIQISLLASAVIFFITVPYIRSLTTLFADISNRIGVDIKYITLVMKVIGIAYVTQFGAELCRDAGEGSIASGIELAGTVVIMTMSMPVMYRLLEVVEQIMRLG